MKVEFVGEKGEDFGGLTKEMFTIFWKEAVRILQRSRLYCALLAFASFKMGRQKCECLGRAMTHIGFLTNTIPTKISCVTYATLGSVE